MAIVMISPTIGIGEREPEIHANCTEKDGKAGQPVCPGVLAVSHECGAADLVAYPDTELGHRFVADEPDDRCCCNRPEKGDFLRVEEPVDGNITGNDRGDQDHQNDKDTGKILDPAVPVREPLGRFPPGKQECEEERDRRECIAEVMDGVGEQCNTTGIIDDDYLEDCGDEQTDKGPLDRPDPAFRGEDGRVDDPVRVAVPAFFFRTMIMTVLVLMLMSSGFVLVFLENHVAVPFSIHFMSKPFCVGFSMRDVCLNSCSGIIRILRNHRVGDGPTYLTR